MKKSSSPRFSKLALGIVAALGSGGAALAQEEADDVVVPIPVVRHFLKDIEDGHYADWVNATRRRR